MAKTQTTLDQYLVAKCSDKNRVKECSNIKSKKKKIKDVKKKKTKDKNTLKQYNNEKGLNKDKVLTKDDHTEFHLKRNQVLKQALIAQGYIVHCNCKPNKKTKIHFHCFCKRMN